MKPFGDVENLIQFAEHADGPFGFKARMYRGFPVLVYGQILLDPVRVETVWECPTV